MKQFKIENQTKLMKIIFKSIVGILIALICISLFFIIQYTHMAGRIIGFIFYISLLMVAIYEFASIFKFPKWVKFYLPIISLIASFNNFSGLIHWFNGDFQLTPLNVMILKEYQFIVFGIPGIGYLFNAIFCLIPFFFLKEFNMKTIFKYFLIFIMITIITIAAKVILFMNVNSIWYLLMICIGTIFTDTFAYFGGSLLGNKIFKRKLAPKISPNKTIEGALIAFIVSWTALFLMIWFIDFDYMNVNRIVLLVVIPICLPALAILGDLLFSAIKRAVKIKDYSNLIPSHGGVLDRFDSLIVTTIIFGSLFMVM